MSRSFNAPLSTTFESLQNLLSMVIFIVVHLLAHSGKMLMSPSVNSPGSKLICRTLLYTIYMRKKLVSSHNDFRQW